ncbi:PNP-UDP-1 domain-containing protein [Fusarium keratoplasticum]|uniref:PNP-UDP-1 domain-containing protein n=1 Tax=Fusarium keratoplasticum TaxID=1328300 RepID=A0ACC0RG45_9HYPO|nr:PNP-UDP-1 domain-containing protein [Fusarium keratoplasticum]KAI8685134.1 PNP-UDP-1 domain-containing protein [Fusarium keratoplasticum]
MGPASEASLITSEPDLADRDSKICCPSGADLLDSIPLEFSDVEDGSGNSSQQILDGFDPQWLSSDIKILLMLPKDLSPLAAQGWSRIRQEILKTTDAALGAPTSDPILEHFRSQQREHRFEDVAPRVVAIPPASRDDFQIAIVCDLLVEYNAISHLVDGVWDENYGGSPGDPNKYTAGRIGPLNIIIVLLSGLRKVRTASETAWIRFSFPNLELLLLTGICGGVPKTGTGNELVLGDVVISNTIVRYERLYPPTFETMNTLGDRLGRSPLHIQNLFTALKASHSIQLLEQQAASHLEKLQSWQSDVDEAANYWYPGADNDQLYPASYLHRHRSTGLCGVCNDDSPVVCDASSKLSCHELGCDVQQRVPRKRLQDSDTLRVPRVFVGRLGLGGIIPTSGEDRDAIAQEHDLIAFAIKYTSASVGIPCIIVKGICDYADNHNSKSWLQFAAVTAASVAKALVEKYLRTDEPSSSRQKDDLEDDPSDNESTSYSPTSGRNMGSVSDTDQRTPARAAYRVIPSNQNESFIPRSDINTKLDQLLPSDSSEFHSAALWGLEGSGDPDCSVFWVQADTNETFTQDYENIARTLGLESSLKGKELLDAVRHGIGSQERWVLVLDNANDLTLFGAGSTPGRQQHTLLNFIPKGPSGTVLWTSCDQRVIKLVGWQRGIRVGKMTIEESTGVYMYNAETSVSEYLSQVKQESSRWQVLGEDEFDRHRWSDAHKSMLRTWSISIRRLKQESQTAYRILHILAFVDNQSIPMELLAAAASYHKKTQIGEGEREQKLKRAVRLLKDFSFMTELQSGDDERTFEMHRLVAHAARYDLRKGKSPGQLDVHFAQVALRVVDGAYPHVTQHNHERESDSQRYLAHALRVCEWAEIHGMEKEAYNLQVRACQFLYWRGRWEEVRLAMETQVRLAQKGFGERHQTSIQALLNLGWTFINLEQLQAAEQCARNTITLASEALGDKDQHTLDCKRLLAVVHRQQGRWKDAKELFMNILDDARQFLDTDHDLTLNCMHELARTYLKLKEYDEADDLLRRLLKLRQDKDGQNHPKTLKVLSLLGDLHYGHGRYDEAVKVLSALLDLERQSLGDEHSTTLITMYNLANSLRCRGQNKEALELMQECSRLRRAILGAEHPHTKYADEAVKDWEREDMEADEGHEDEGMEVDEDSVPKDVVDEVPKREDMDVEP